MANQMINQQQIRIIKLDVLAPSYSDNERWNMARRLAMVCHYLNTRCRTGANFFNGGVTDKFYVNPDDPTDIDEGDYIYLRVNDDEIVDLTPSDQQKNSLGLLNTNFRLDDGEIRDLAFQYVGVLRDRCRGLSFLNIMQ